MTNFTIFPTIPGKKPVHLTSHPILISKYTLSGDIVHVS